MWKLVCTHIRDDRLRQAFSVQTLLVGGNPFDTTCIYGLIHYLERKWGVHFPMGGTGALIDGLTKLMREQGIEIRLNTTIDKIETSNGKATAIITEDGQRCVFDTFISDVDPTHLYGRLISTKEQSLSARVKTRFAKISMGLFVLYFGTAKEYPDVAHHTLWMGARYKALLDDIFEGKVLAEDFSLYIHRPTATDPSFAPAGHDAFYVLVPVPNLSSSINWSVEADKLSSRVIEALDSTILPGLKTVIRSPFYMTPEDYSTEYLSTLGSGFSIAPLFSQSAWFRYHNQGEGLENLYLVGAGTHPGAGLPGVLSSAKVVEKLIKLKASDI